jgi:hypothetical protein
MKGIWVVEKLVKTSPGWIKRHSVSSRRYTTRTFRCILRYLHTVPNSLDFIGLTHVSKVQSDRIQTQCRTRRIEQKNGLVLGTPATTVSRTVSKNTLSLISTASIPENVLSASHEPVRGKQNTGNQFLVTRLHTPARVETQSDGTSV